LNQKSLQLNNYFLVFFSTLSKTGPGFCVENAHCAFDKCSTLHSETKKGKKEWQKIFIKLFNYLILTKKNHSF